MGGEAKIGRTLADVGLSSDVEVTGVRRRGSRARRPAPDYRFESGDIVVLLGRPEALMLAEQKLLRKH